jgi:hypothetical protein
MPTALTTATDLVLLYIKERGSGIYQMLPIVLFSLVSALPDVRLDPQQKDAPKGINYREPDTFGLQALRTQKVADNDQFLRSNIDNQANKRNAALEKPLDMLPCRQDQKGQLMTFRRGVPIELPLRWNNPHDSDCEINIWVDGMRRVSPIKRPFNCGGGYQDQRFNFIIPNDFPGCETPSENCFVQLYGHSVEPRTYAICIDFVLERGTNTNTTFGPLDLETTQFQPAIHYWDSFDTAHVDSAYSGYRGQQGEFIRDELKAAIQLQSYLGNGGLVPLGDIDKEKTQKMRDEVQKAVKAAEQLAIKKNQEAQQQLDAETNREKLPRRCFEGELYNVVNNPGCARQFTNTYVTNVGYRKIYQEFLPKFIAANLTSYTPKRKNLIGQTPEDPFGGYQVLGKPSTVPLNQISRNALQPQPAPPRLPGPESPELQNLASRVGQPKAPIPLPSNFVEQGRNTGIKVEMNPDDILLREKDKTPLQKEEQRKISVTAVIITVAEPTQTIAITSSTGAARTVAPTTTNAPVAATTVPTGGYIPRPGSAQSSVAPAAPTQGVPPPAPNSGSTPNTVPSPQSAPVPQGNGIPPPLPGQPSPVPPQENAPPTPQTPGSDVPPVDSQSQPQGTSPITPYGNLPVPQEQPVENLPGSGPILSSATASSFPILCLFLLL